MSSLKGVVMRVTGKNTVVYTEQGDFINIRTPVHLPAVGQVIDVPAQPRRFFKSGAFLKYATIAATLFIVLTLGLIHPLVWPLGGAVASVELNINNGVRLQVDKAGKVTSVHSTVPESNDPVEELPLKGLDVYQAVKLIVEDAGTKGNFGHEQSVVMVSVVPVDEDGADVVDPDKLRGVVHDEMLRQEATGMVMVDKSSREVGSKARELGMTVNSYLVYERCRQDGLEVQAEVFRGRNVNEAMVEANVSLNKLFPGQYVEVKGRESKSEVKEIIVHSGSHMQEPGEEAAELRRHQPGSRNTAWRLDGLQVRVPRDENAEKTFRLSDDNNSSGKVFRFEGRDETRAQFNGDTRGAKITCDTMKEDKQRLEHPGKSFRVKTDKVDNVSKADKAYYVDNVDKVNYVGKADNNGNKAEKEFPEATVELVIFREQPGHLPVRLGQHD